MKKIITALVALAAWCGVATAQDVVRDTAAAPVADSVEADEPNVIGGRVDSSYLQRRPRTQKEQNIFGTPVYYSPSLAKRPAHHYRNSLSDRYCGFFVEAESMFGPHYVALGANFTYLPERWGAYASLLGGYRGSYLSAGPAVRLSGYDDDLDWHLYGGVVFADNHVGCEGGVRIASIQRGSDFCWMSASMGLGVIAGDTYLTLGVSLDIVAVTTLAFLMF